ncbi:MAG: tRNA (guanosine(37)-N1)-methyltransferase TrmD [Candidatus Omnitrophota bacterium]|nr:tRNA (guanosine(37)-N1)-methyltransferase TrmD [Candidatus Omnitrophota bacterium]
MRIDIITIFPDMFSAVLDESIIKRAQNKGKLKIHIHNLRDYTLDKHRKVDDRPFGGGSGMVMSPEPIFRAVENILRHAPCAMRHASKKRKAQSAERKVQSTKIILLSPQGKTLTQGLVKKLAKNKHLVLICGHYEGIDERVRDNLADSEISIGDYVLTGGEVAAMVLVDVVTRLIPGVLGDKNSLKFESFEGNLLEYPQYTRPADFRGRKVPQVLLSGNHKEIDEWRKYQALKVTRLKRPDLLNSTENKEGVIK